MDEIDNDKIVYTSIKDNREMILSRYMVKITFNIEESALEAYIVKLKAIFMQLQRL